MEEELARTLDATQMTTYRELDESLQLGTARHLRSARGQ
jgi:hypothetical protein